MNPKNLYELWHKELPVESGRDSPWHQLIKQYLADKRLVAHSVLEVACGRGAFACWLASQYPHVVACDFAMSALLKGKEHADNHLNLKISWNAADIQRLPFRSGSFDVVVSCETIEHVVEPEKAVIELARVLRPGGMLFLTTPNYLSTMGLYRVYLRLRGRRYTETGQPINNVTLFPLTRKWIRSAGLRILNTDGIGHYLLYPGRAPIELPFFNNPRILMRWVALHSFFAARKPVNSDN